MKVLLVSFYNDEAYGVRAIHSNLIENSIDAYMLFFKLDNYREKSKDETQKKDFVGDTDGVSSNEIEILRSHIKEKEYDAIGLA
jgi:hypothetical protein